MDAHRPKACHFGVFIQEEAIMSHYFIPIRFPSAVEYK